MPSETPGTDSGTLTSNLYARFKARIETERPAPAPELYRPWGNLPPGVKLVHDFKGLSNLDQDLSKVKSVALDTTTAEAKSRSRLLVLVQLEGHGLIHAIDVSRCGQVHVTFVIKNLLESSIVKIGHNLKHHLKTLVGYLPGINLNSVIGLYDTMIAEQILQAGLADDPKAFESNTLLKQYLKINSAQQPQRLTSPQVEPDPLALEHLMAIQEKQIARLQETDLLNTAELEFSIIPLVAAMEINGMGIDMFRLREKKAEYEAMGKDALSKLKAIWLAHHLGLVNFNSPPQVLDGLRQIWPDLPNTKKETM
ncbi:MAG: hypothetical protein HQK58_12930, partial [Deltaproteobacteria bacterium]|nr:hypothetical protein [Deltaproteobacteria bacterium]